MRQFRAMNPVPIGAAFIVALGLLVYLGVTFQSLPFVSGTTYSAAFADAAGLRTGDEVRIAGVSVGHVTGIHLEGDHVRVSFDITDGSVHLGRLSTASIEIFTLLGNKYLALQPSGGGTWPADRELPLSQTTTPYDVTTAFEDLSNTVGQVDTRQLAAAFQTLASTFRNSPPEIHGLLSGLSRLSQTVASRDEALSQLLQHAAGVTGVLADRRTQVVALVTDGDRLLRMLEDRQQVVAQLVSNTAALSTQLSGLVADNQRTIGPLLDNLHGVVLLLQTNEAQLDQIIRRLYVWTRGNVDTIGSGPWFDGVMINALNPYQLPPGSTVPGRTANPQTFGQLLRVPTPSPSAGG